MFGEAAEISREQATPTFWSRKVDLGARGTSGCVV